MKQTLLAVALGAALVSPTVSAVELKTEEQKVSYSVGLMVGEQLKSLPDVDFDAFIEAAKTTYEGKEPKMTPEQVREVMTAFQQKQMEAQKKKMEELSANNLEKGKKYLTENGKKSGVKTTESGLQYEELQAGKGKSPTAEDTVKVHYRGTLIDGTEFDSSYARNEPVSFPLNGVIPGWTEGLQMIKEGGKARLVIPSDLAYGPGGMGNAIGPNETLVFEVELLEVNPGADEAAKAEK
ncbi:FKBP-type peptidyl-prolyl cis-trans isomerase [uncultured Neptuniibacter sp.]|uniref:FKBP-type peptidyl-prolyl cis-trans isomerase n=1 Tax=uncultured Neptuniibacter sp. TaxID=502143 RepID=UPI00261C8D5E|nr:FKBP-type peptidyl-prolyl cis-trans isomerase [uncultured Neptuniibacter sp.]